MSFLDALGQGATVVTANDRLARHLRWRFDRLQLAEGAQAWPSADILSWAQWLERLYRASVTGHKPSADVELLTRDQARLLWQDIVGSHGGVTGTVKSVLEAWRLVRAWGISTSSIRLSSRSADSDAFGAWSIEFERRCLERGWIDPSSLPDWIFAALRDGRIHQDVPVCFVGFAQPNAQQTRIQAATPSHDVKRSEPRAGNAARVECADPRQEREVAARWARHLLERRGAEVVAIVVPDLQGQGAAFRRSCLEVLAPEWRTEPRQRLPLDMASGRPLSEIGLVRVALLVLQLGAGRIDYRDIGVLLRTNYLRGGHEEAGPRAAVDLGLRERNEQNIDLRHFIAASGPAGGAPGFADSVTAVLEWATANTRQMNSAQWAISFGKILREAGWLEGAALTSDDYQAARAWSKAMQTFAGCSEVVGKVGFQTAIRILSDVAQNQVFQPEGRMDGVQIMAPGDVPGHEFDGIWISGLSSEAWPPPARPNPLIPFELQTKHGVPNTTPLGTREAASELMQELLSSAPEALASYPRQRKLETLVPSPMLPDHAAVVEEILQHRGETYRGEMFRSRSMEDVSDDPAPEIKPGAEVRGGSQLLKWQAACPARAFFEFRLGAREMSSPSYGIDALLRGTIIHDALEMLYSSLAKSGELAEIDVTILNEQIDRAIEASLNRHLSSRHPLAGALGANEHGRMRELLVGLLENDRSRPRFTIEALECKDTVTLGQITLNLRLDRIDRFEHGERLVIDYKTGAKFATKDWLGERPPEPQLPLYAATNDVQGIAVVLLNQGGVKMSGVVADALETGGLKSAARFSRDDGADWDALVGEWKFSLKNLADEIARGDCRIDRNNLKPADGEFAMLTRIHSNRDKGQGA